MRSAAVFLALMISAPANTHEQPVLPQRAQAPDQNPLDCYCRAQGQMFAPGEKVCLKTTEGSRLAQCRMEINVMSWSVTEMPCPET